MFSYRRWSGGLGMSIDINAEAMMDIAENYKLVLTEKQAQGIADDFIEHLQAAQEMQSYAHVGGESSRVQELEKELERIEREADKSERILKDAVLKHAGYDTNGSRPPFVNIVNGKARIER